MYTVKFIRADGTSEQIWNTFNRRRDAISYGETTVMEDYFWNKGPPVPADSDEDTIAHDRFFRDAMTVDFKVVKLHR